MRSCYLHIGMHKTGSTAIQMALHRYDDGSTACLQLDLPNHSAEMFTAFSERRGTILMQHLPRPGSAAELAVSIRERILAQVTASDRNIIISAEAMSLRFSEPEIAALRAFLAPHFDRLHVIVYLREPYAAMRSGLQELIKQGAYRFDLQASFPRYRVRLQPWLDAFGPDAMEFVCFDPAAWRGGSVVTDFERRVGVVLPQSETQRANESLSAEACAITFLLNRHAREHPVPSFRDRLRDRVEGPLVGHYGTTPFELDQAACTAVIDAMQDEIRWAEARLGRAFPPPRPLRGGTAFGSEADFLAYAQTVRKQFRAWCRSTISLRERASAMNRLLRNRPPKA